MANVQKYKQAAVGHMLQHYDRRTGDNVKRANQDIDPAKTHLNYDLHSGQTADSARTNVQQEWLKKRLSEVKHRDLTKFDDNLFCDWVITLPSDVPKEREADFFKAVYDFCCDRYGNANFKDFMAAMKWLYSADIQSVNAYIRNSQRERER